MAQDQPEAIARPARMSEPEIKNSKSQATASRTSAAQAKPSGTSYLGLFVGVAVILAGYVYQMHVKPTLTLLGSNETIGNLNNQVSISSNTEARADGNGRTVISSKNSLAAKINGLTEQAVFLTSLAHLLPP